MHCVLCGSPNARERRAVSGTRYGWSCEPCHPLVWEAWAFAPSRLGSSAADAELLRWEWRRRRAEAAGRPFAEPHPASPGERAVAALIAREAL